MQRNLHIRHEKRPSAKERQRRAASLGKHRYYFSLYNFHPYSIKHMWRAADCDAISLSSTQKKADRKRAAQARRNTRGAPRITFFYNLPPPFFRRANFLRVQRMGNPNYAQGRSIADLIVSGLNSQEIRNRLPPTLKSHRVRTGRCFSGCIICICDDIANLRPGEGTSD